MAVFNTQKAQGLHAVFESCDAFLLTSCTNIRYLTGFSGSLAYCLVTPDKAFAFVDGRYTQQAQQETSGVEVVTYRGNLADELRKFSFASVGLELDSISYSQYKSISGIFQHSKFTNVSDFFARLRTVKSSDEIRFMSDCARIADAGFEHIKSCVRPGVSERDVAAELDFFLRKNGSDGVSFSTIVASGERGSLPHVSPSDKKIDHGDAVVIDFGCTLNGYCSDMTRTLFVSEIGSEQLDVYSAVLEAQLAAIDLCRPGLPAAEAEAACRSVLKKYDLDSFFVHSLGHGVGLEVHELPRLSSSSKDVLAENMVFTIEPGVYLDGKFGVRIEDMVVLTAGGVVFLSNSPKAPEQMIV